MRMKQLDGDHLTLTKLRSQGKNKVFPYMRGKHKRARIIFLQAPIL